MFGDRMPKGLYARALIIIIAPMVILQSVVAFVFMERHWQTVTKRLSTVTVQNIAMMMDLYQANPQEGDALSRLAEQNLGMRVNFVPGEDLPQVRSKPFFDLLDSTLSDEITRQIGRPFWVDTVGRSNLVDIRIKLDNAVMHVLARRSQTYASNSQIFLLWMVGTSLVLLTVAILFLRNQIKPILRLSEAAESFGKGRPPPDDFRPRGAREVRQAAHAFIEMRDRIERQIERFAPGFHRHILARHVMRPADLESAEQLRLGHGFPGIHESPGHLPAQNFLDLPDKELVRVALCQQLSFDQRPAEFEIVGKFRNRREFFARHFSRPGNQREKTMLPHIRNGKNNRAFI